MEEDIYVSTISCMWIECKLGMKECRDELEIIDGILELQLKFPASRGLFFASSWETSASREQLKWLNLIISEQQ